MTTVTLVNGYEHFLRSKALVAISRAAAYKMPGNTITLEAI